MPICKVVLRQRNLKLHWTSSDGWFASRGYELWHSDNEGTSWRRITIFRKGWTNWCSKFPLLAQAGRLGIHNLIRLSSGTLICIVSGTLFRSTDMGTTFLPVLSEFNGYRVLRNGVCQDGVGRVYLGEYWLNKERGAARLWRSDDDGLTWDPVHTWTPGTVRHVHFVQFDPYEKKVWVGTGDEDHECQIACSRNGGVSFEVVGGGAQTWRAVSVLFTAESVFWGTDMGIDHDTEPNYIVRWDRSTRSLHKVLCIGGPAYYSTITAEGILAIGTAVERGRNQKDSYVHLYWSDSNHTWNSERLWRKWPLPDLLGPATITFPLSDRPIPRLLFNVDFVCSKYNGALLEAML